jgi:hypothetical protein
MNVAGYTTCDFCKHPTFPRVPNVLAVLLLLSFLLLPDSGILILAVVIIYFTVLYCTVLYCTMGHIRLSNYRNMDIGLLFFSAI